MDEEKLTETTRARVTAWEVARRAAVSQSAVSRAFSGGAGVSSATRARIMAAAEALGYQPNALARGLITRRSGMVGIVVSDLSNAFLADAMELMSQRLRAAGLKALLIAANNVEDVGAAFPELEQYQVDGCFVICPHLSRRIAKKYNMLGTIVLMFNRAVPGLVASSVWVDNVSAGRTVADLLVDEEHEVIGYLHGTKGSATDRDRHKGFSRRLAERDREPPVIGWGDYTYRGGYEALLGLLAGHPRLTAVFCANDSMAFGAMDAARYRLGLTVPGDLSIVGFDDGPTAAWPSYSLTTVRQPMVEMVNVGIELMLAQIDQPGQKPRGKVLDGELILRGTTRTDGARSPVETPRKRLHD